MGQSKSPVSICPLASGSKGNSYYIESGGISILVDAGLSYKRLSERLVAVGRDILDIDHVFITHEHKDHTQAVALILKRSNPVLWASRGTLRSLRNIIPDGARVRMMNGNVESIDNLNVEAISISHDAAEPVSYVFTWADASIAVLTDLGVWDKNLVAKVNGADILVCEANHDPEMLQKGPYPYILKRRVASNTGHLSNFDGASFAVEAVKMGTKHVVLAHLSESNNSPGLALETFKDTLAKNSLSAAVEIASQDHPGPWISLNGMEKTERKDYHYAV
jgi:phosphoribosyl 1,2-cyclic phosphodiesterase